MSVHPSARERSRSSGIPRAEGLAEIEAAAECFDTALAVPMIGKRNISTSNKYSGAQQGQMVRLHWPLMCPQGK